MTRAARLWTEAMRGLARYHDWQIVGTEHIPVDTGAVVTCTHSLASYELFIMGCASRHLLGKQAYIVGDDLMFRAPGLRPTLEEIGYIPRKGRDDVVERLRRGQLIGIAPGGMRESLRDRRERYAFDWSDRRGFVWVAMRAGVPIVPAVCAGADEIFTVYGNPLTRWAYETLKLPLPVFRGLGPTPLPRPVKLLSIIGEPIHADVPPDRVVDADVEHVHARVVRATEALLVRALALRASAAVPGAQRFALSPAA